MASKQRALTVQNKEAKGLSTTNGNVGWIANYIWGIANEGCAARPLRPGQISSCVGFVGIMLRLRRF